MNVVTNGVPVASNDVDHVVSVLREQVVALAAQTGRAPSVVRLSARDVTVEVHWPEAAVPTPVSAPAAPVRAAVPVPVPEPSIVDRGGHEVCATTVGVFYHAAEPGAKPFVSVGDEVKAGQQIGIVEAMKLMIPVESDRAGTVLEVLVPDGTAVEYGQPLVSLEPR
ncbi:biotin/lipoyl-containing protein [Actinosynnema sp. NPDC020468]|uniref:acetyl-CoA carboxylase biotin carboxyl carrier protein n=1 Tax=Actinosynnema sp. NPDC020468 TaxID=3154488 RepID=UPI00340376AD